MTNKRGDVPYLKLLPKSDLSASSLLASKNDTELHGVDAVSGPFSLYANWPSYRSAVLVEVKSGTTYNCELSFDEDEINPSEIYLKVDGLQIDLNNSSLEFNVLFEVFNVAYVFSINLVGEFTHESATTRYVLEVPERLTVKKLRSLPRFQVPSSLNQQAILSLSSSEEKLIASIIELGISGVKLSIENFQQTETLSGSIKISNLSFNGSLEKRNDGSSIFKINFTDPEQFGDYFDYYRSLVFPTLVPKSSVNYHKLYDTYLKTGFFDKYVNTASAEENKMYQELLISTWKEIAGTQHSSTAEYASLDDDGNPVGACSLVKAFYHENREVWITTQMCVISEPQFFNHTRDLYLWRTAYTFGRPNDLDCILWYDGNSRFLERIWTRFAKLCGSSERLWPVDIRRLPKERLSLANSESLDVSTVKEPYGTFERIMLKDSNVMGGVGPTYLNFGKLLDHVVSVPPNKVSVDELFEKASLLLNLEKNDLREIRVSVPAGFQDERLNDCQKILLNRLGYYPKHEIPILYSSILHALAVMEAKHKDS